MIIIQGEIQIDPSDVAAFERDIRTINPLILPDSGCLFYVVTVVDAVGGRLAVSERWRDQGSLTAHLNRSEAVSFMTVWGGRMRGNLSVFDAQNERALGGRLPPLAPPHGGCRQQKDAKPGSSGRVSTERLPNNRWMRAG
ncbi:putative quinol monooxygenase [Rhizobium wuzhouense]|nr:antibiotic biosynthesis monooxygenase [Rhizobium wuzhouense]